MYHSGSLVWIFTYYLYHLGSIMTQKKELNKLVAVLNIFAGGHANLLTRHSLMFLFHKCISFHMRLHFGKLRYFFIFDAC